MEKLPSDDAERTLQEALSHGHDSNPAFPLDSSLQLCMVSLLQFQESHRKTVFLLGLCNTAGTLCCIKPSDRKSILRIPGDPSAVDRDRALPWLYSDTGKCCNLSGTGADRPVEIHDVHHTNAGCDSSKFPDWSYLVCPASLALC